MEKNLSCSALDRSETMDSCQAEVKIPERMRRMEATLFPTAYRPETSGPMRKEMKYRSEMLMIQEQTVAGIRGRQ